MPNRIIAASVSALIVLTTAGAASASESRHVRRHGQHPIVVINGVSRNAVAYYPGWGRDPVLVYGVYPGLIYGGAASAPAKR